MGRYISKKQNIQEANALLEKRLINENSGWAQMGTLSPMDEQDQSKYSKEELKSIKNKIQEGLNRLTTELNNKPIKMNLGTNEYEFYLKNFSIQNLIGKKNRILEGDIVFAYGKERGKYLAGDFNSSSTPMVSNEFTDTLRVSSSFGGPTYTSSELQNYLNKVISQIL